MKYHKITRANASESYESLGLILEHLLAMKQQIQMLPSTTLDEIGTERVAIRQLALEAFGAEQDRHSNLVAHGGVGLGNQVAVSTMPPCSEVGEAGHAVFSVQELEGCCSCLRVRRVQTGEPDISGRGDS